MQSLQDLAGSYNTAYQGETEVQAGYQRALGTIHAAMEAEFAQMQVKTWLCCTCSTRLLSGRLGLPVAFLSALPDKQLCALQATALAEAQARLRAARSHTAEDYNMLKLTMEAKRNELLRVLGAEHKTYTKATDARAEVRHWSELAERLLQSHCCVLPALDPFWLHQTFAYSCSCCCCTPQHMSAEHGF